jgi:hypothetical protein
MPPPRPVTFEIAGHRGDPLACVLHADGDEPVAVVFPGAVAEGGRLGGSPARPDLSYTRSVLRAEGLAVFEVWWDTGPVPRDELDGWIAANAEAALAAATEDRPLAALVGRSLGTIALSGIVSHADWESRAVPTIWIAPLLTLPNVAEALEELRTPAFVVGGTGDPAFDPGVIERLGGPTVEIAVIEGAHHGLELADDPAESARLLAGVLERMREFVVRSRSAS